jgi:hypothetical protein
MVEQTKSASYSIDKDNIDWLNKQKQATGIPQSHLINKGLRNVRGMEKINILKFALIPACSFLMGTALIIFDMLFINQMPFVVVILLFAVGIAVEVISMVVLLITLLKWRKMK